MTCSEFAELVHDLARPGRLDRETCAIARAHAENCPACGCQLAEAETMARAFAVAANESRKQEAPAWLERELMEKFRCEQNARRVVPRRWRRGWRIALEWAAVSAAVAGIAVVTLRRVPDRQPAPTVRDNAAQATGNGATVAAARPAAVPSKTAVATEVAAVSKGAPARWMPGTARLSSANAFATEFVPVPFAGSLSPGESAVIVRVQLPRSALEELGYPIDETPSEQMIRADLVVGPDGWPRAVRIVR